MGSGICMTSSTIFIHCMAYCTSQITVWSLWSILLDYKQCGVSTRAQLSGARSRLPNNG